MFRRWVETVRGVFSYGKAEHARVLELQAQMRAEVARLEALSAETEKTRQTLPESLARVRESMASMEKQTREAEEAILAMQRKELLRKKEEEEKEAARVVEDVKKVLRKETTVKDRS